MAENYYVNQDEAPYGVARLGPKYKITDIFDKFPKEEKNMNYYFDYVIAGVIGFGLPGYANVFRSVKIFKNIHIHLAVAATFIAGTHFAKLYGEDRNQKIQAICRDYVAKNPEKFPEIERKKFKQVLNDWYPSREI